MKNLEDTSVEELETMLANKRAKTENQKQKEKRTLEQEFRIATKAGEELIEEKQALIATLERELIELSEKYSTPIYGTKGTYFPKSLEDKEEELGKDFLVDVMGSDYEYYGTGRWISSSMRC